RNRSPLPRAYLVTQALPEQGSTLESLTTEAWNPKDSVILRGISDPQGIGGGPGTVEWVEQKPERLELRSETTGTGWVVVTDNDYPGWSAEVDGHRVAIQRANYLFRAVQVPAGDHRIVFHYAPRSWLIGGAGSCLTLVLTFVWLFLGRKAARP
ncbi:MAG: YfhO family protein, partial [Acidobacteria bacterium]|nr:YfhO family protein [Acidobacteriota bacterium]